MDLDWTNEETQCTGATRPDGGIRLGFSRAIFSEDQRLVVLFGIPGLKEGRDARTLPVNVTVIRQGTGQFFSTQGDDKCMIDELRQEPLTGIPHRERTYRIVARGFCTSPLRAVGGDGAVFISRFDYAGRVDFSLEDAEDESVPARTESPPLTDRSNDW